MYLNLIEDTHSPGRLQTRGALPTEDDLIVNVDEAEEGPVEREASNYQW